MRLPIAVSTSAAMQLSIDLLNTLNGHGDLGGPLNVTLLPRRVPLSNLHI